MNRSSYRTLSSSWALLLCTFATGFVLPWTPTTVTRPRITYSPESSSKSPFAVGNRRPANSGAAAAAAAAGVTMSGSTGGLPVFSPEVLALLDSKGLKIRELTEANLPAAVEIEAASYPEDEAASPENMRFRRANAGDFFLEATLKGEDDGSGGSGGGELIGFVCGTCSQGEELSHESMHLHDPTGQTLCIHSVAVAEKYRRRGYATAMLKAYVENIALTQPGVRRICLIAKAGLLGMYASCGFSLKGLSTVVHGKDPWFEMRKDLDSTAPRLLQFVQIDSFTERKFSGNPAAVFFTQAGGNADWMQKVAVEMNLSETCFLELQPADPEDSEEKSGPVYALRWFTPGGEVDLCGHATLAAAHALWEERRVDPGLSVRFSTASGVLTCRRDGEGWIAMDFPAEEVGDPLPDKDEVRLAVIQALRLSEAGNEAEDGEGKGNGGALFVGRNRVDVMVEVTPDTFATLQPDMGLLAAIKTRGIIVTCKGPCGADNKGGGGGGKSVDFQSRFFAPRLGINEDPVTGSAHCCLAPYWGSKLGRSSVVGYQASPRGGTVRATILSQRKEGEKGVDRVVLEGKAVTVFHGLFGR